jgi:hypothetical protein
MKLLDLPNEIWIKILSNIDQNDLLNLSLVSKKVKELVLDPALWTNLKIRRLYHISGLDIYKGRDLPIFAFDLTATKDP